MAAPVLHHVNLKTIRLDEMISWYGDVIGAEVVFKYEAGAWISNDLANHRIALLSVPGLSDDPEHDAHVGLHHSAYEFASFAELMDTYERLAAKGIEPQVCFDHGMTLSLYYRDPDRNMVELQIDSYGAWAQSKEFMQSSPLFKENPIGMPFEPARLLELHRQGVAFEEIEKRTYAGEFMPSTPPDLGLPTPPPGPPGVG